MPTIQALATFSPTLPSRAWQSIAHPSLPLLATATAADNAVALYDLGTFRHRSTVSGGHKRSVRAVAWQPGSGRARRESVLVTGSFDASVGVWRRSERGGADAGAEGEAKEEDDDDDDDDGEQGEESFDFAVLLDGHESEVKSVSFNAAGNLLATCGRDKSVWIWEEVERDNWETVAVLAEHEGDVKSVAWHPRADVLASSSYDDSVRLYREDVDDWVACAKLEGHRSTVWAVVWEKAGGGREEGEGERLASCSDDRTVKIWRRVTKGDEKESADKIPSILRTRNIEEEWECEVTLPETHERAIYSVDWSSHSGRIVSTGSDGKIVVYQEDGLDSKEWKIIAEYEGAHGVYEINHVTWVKRSDRGKKSEDEEMIVTTGDDGEVRCWILDA